MKDMYCIFINVLNVTISYPGHFESSADDVRSHRWSQERTLYPEHFLFSAKDAHLHRGEPSITLIAGTSVRVSISSTRIKVSWVLSPFMAVRVRQVIVFCGFSCDKMFFSVGDTQLFPF